MSSSGRLRIRPTPESGRGGGGCVEGRIRIPVVDGGDAAEPAPAVVWSEDKVL